MKLVTKVAAVAAVRSMTVSAFAAGGASSASSSTVKESGFYLGANIGYGKSKLNGAGILNQTKNTGLSGGGYLGYQVNKYFAVELGMNSLPSITYSALGVSLKASYYEAYLALKGMLPLKNHFGLYAKLGSSTVNEDITGSSSANETGLFCAAGVSYALPQNFTVNLDMQGTHMSDFDSYAGVAGVSYLF